jgi:hypothetical protein
VGSGGGSRIEAEELSMPASFQIKQSGVDELRNELRNIEPALVNQMRRELRSDLKPLATSLASGIPSKSPVSGFSGKNAQSPYIWKKPSVKVDTDLRPRFPGTSLLVIRFKDARPNAGFSILERAGIINKGKDRKGNSYRGDNLVRGLQTAGFGLKDRGRFVIPQFYERSGEAMAIAQAVILKYTAMVNVKLKTKGV